MHCGTFSSMLGLHPLDASSTSHSVTTDNAYRHCHVSLEGTVILIKNIEMKEHNTSAA